MSLECRLVQSCCVGVGVERREERRRQRWWLGLNTLGAQSAKPAAGGWCGGVHCKWRCSKFGVGTDELHAGDIMAETSYLCEEP